MKKYRKSYKNNKFKISAPTWNEEPELADKSYLYQIFKISLNIWGKHGEKTISPSIRIHINKI